MVQATLPTPYIFEIDTPLIVHQRRLLQPRSPTNNNDNYAEFNNRKYALEEIVSPRVLEDLYVKHNQDIVNRIQERYIREHLQQEFTSKRQLAQRSRENKALALVVEKILPTITADIMAERIDDIVTEGHHPQPESIIETDVEITARDRQVVSDINRRLLKDIEEGYRRFTLDEGLSQIDNRIQQFLVPTGQNSTLAELVGNYNLMRIDHKIYELLTAPQFLSIFQQGMTGNLYAQVLQLPTNQDPQETIDWLKRRIQFIETKYRSRMINKLRSSKVKIANQYYFPIILEIPEGEQYKQIKKQDLVERYTHLLEKKNQKRSGASQ